MHRPIVPTLAVLLASSLAAQSVDDAGEFPNDWFWHSTAEQRAAHAAMIGEPMPKLELADWMNGELDLTEDLDGKVVVVDFWATWCPPCIASIPHNNELWSEHREDGLVLLGVCSSDRGQDQMAEVARVHDIRYPTAKDPNQVSAKAWNVMWWPTYGVVDRAGVLRAIGLKPDRVDDVVEKLLTERAPAEKTPMDADQTVEIPAEWREGNVVRREKLDYLEGEVPPPLQVDGWMNSEPLELTNLRGKVVLLAFWATWCRPCMSAMPKLEELAAQHEDLVVIGICHTDGAEEMEQVAKRQGIGFPIARDVEGTTAAIYRVDSFPDYYLIGRHGRLRVADLANMEVERAVERLLSEPAPGESDPAPGAPQQGGKRPPQRDASGRGGIQESELEQGRGDR